MPCHARTARHHRPPWISTHPLRIGSMQYHLSLSLSISLSISISISPSFPLMDLRRPWTWPVSLTLSISFFRSLDCSGLDEFRAEGSSPVQSMLWNGMACGGEDGLPHLLQICAKYFYFVRPRAMASGSARMRHKSSGTHRGSAGAGVARQRVHHKCDFVVLLRLQSPRRS